MILNPLLVDRVEAALDVIRPALEMDGGTVELIEITADMTVRLNFVGSCGGCPLSALTLKLGIERTLREHVPEIAGVEAEGMGEPIWERALP
ncbi:MAG TPA: NifU family protein [Dehalococcoidia bacterium]|nr:NifU family protein [Dehalococcoidia bacterium]